MEKIEIVRFKPTFVKLAPGSPSENEQKTPILEIFRTISPKQRGDPLIFFYQFKL